MTPRTGRREKDLRNRQPHRSLLGLAGHSDVVIFVHERLGDPAAVGDGGEGVRDDKDADALGKGDPDVGADRMLCEQVADRVDDRFTGWCSAKARTGPGMVSVGTKAELMNGRKFTSLLLAAATSRPLGR